MKSAFPYNPTHPDPGVGRAHFLLSLGLVSAMLFAVILGSFHHHHDLTDHPDCAVCAVAHHADNAPATPTLSILALPALPVLFALLVPTVPVVGTPSLLRSRAPPL